MITTITMTPTTTLTKKKLNLLYFFQVYNVYYICIYYRNSSRNSIIIQNFVCLFKKEIYQVTK